jgi:hypothetical protein
MLLKIAGSPGTPATMRFLVAGCPGSVPVPPAGFAGAGAHAARANIQIVQAINGRANFVMALITP